MEITRKDMGQKKNRKTNNKKQKLMIIIIIAAVVIVIMIIMIIIVAVPTCHSQTMSLSKLCHSQTFALSNRATLKLPSDNIWSLRRDFVNQPARKKVQKKFGKVL